MPRTMQEILDHADELAASLEADDRPAGTPIDATPIHFLRAAVIAQAEAERSLAVAVAQARAAGIPWSAIGSVLGVSSQGAQQRYRDIVMGEDIAEALAALPSRST